MCRVSMLLRCLTRCTFHEPHNHYPRGVYSPAARELAVAKLAVRLPVLGGEEQRGEWFQCGREFVELLRPQALVRCRCELIGEGLDPLFEGAAGFAQPAVISDQLAIAHPF